MEKSFITTEQIKKEVNLEARKRMLSILDEEIYPDIYSVRIGISKDCFAQLYFNIEKKKFLMAVIKSKTRIYGFDRLDEDCHEHPVENPEKHVKKPCNEMDLAKFLDRATNLCRGEGHG